MGDFDIISFLSKDGSGVYVIGVALVCGFILLVLDYRQHKERVAKQINDMLAKLATQRADQKGDIAGVNLAFENYKISIARDTVTREDLRQAIEDMGKTIAAALAPVRDDLAMLKKHAINGSD